MTTGPSASTQRTVAVAGASGMIGRLLVEALLARGDGVVALVRSPGSHPFPSSVEVRRSDAVVNLVGSPIFAERWTPARKQDLTDNRLASTRSLVEGLRKRGGQGRTFVCSNAVDYAGDTGDREVDETTPAGKGFLAELAVKWEAEAQRVKETGARLVSLRQGLVLGREGGTLAALLPSYRRGFGGTMGPGGQWVAWIHVNDAARLIVHAVDRASIAGPLVSCSPNPVTSREFARILARAVHRPRLAPMPARVMSLLWGERAELLLASHRAVPRLALATGFRFRFPTLQTALADLLRPHPTPVAQLMDQP
jgi:uncharacterized protein